jgi:hypothetical protein
MILCRPALIIRIPSSRKSAIASGEQAALRTEVDRDILAKGGCNEHRPSLLLPPCWCTLGRPCGYSEAQLSTVSNWTRVYEVKSLGIVRGVLSPPNY